MTDQNKSVSSACANCGSLPGARNHCDWIECPALGKPAAPVLAAAGVMQPVDERALLMKFVATITGATSLGENRVYDLSEALVKIARAALSAGPTQAAVTYTASDVDVALELAARWKARALKAESAAEQTATTASASIDTPEFRELLSALEVASPDREDGAHMRKPYDDARRALITFIDSHAQAPSQDAPAAQAVDLNKLAILMAHYISGNVPDDLYWKVDVTAEALRRAFAVTRSPAAQAVERAAPDGFAIVPELPTIEMQMAALNAARRCKLDDGQPRPLPKGYELWSATFIYRAMIDAAPAAPAVEPSALRMFMGAAYPVAKSIDARGYRWSEAYLDQALAAALANPAPTGAEPTQAARDVLADDAGSAA